MHSDIIYVCKYVDYATNNSKNIINKLIDVVRAIQKSEDSDPSKKDFIIGNVSNKSWDSIKLEMEKCVLLCANCHMIEHSTKNDAKFLKEALCYKGRNLEFKKLGL